MVSSDSPAMVTAMQRTEVFSQTGPLQLGGGEQRFGGLCGRLRSIFRPHMGVMQHAQAYHLMETSMCIPAAT